MKLTFNFSLVLLMTINFSNCSSAQKLQKKVPFSLGQVYSQSWIAGVKGGGSGINLFIPLTDDLPETIQLDSVFFRGKRVKLEVKSSSPKLYVGRFLTESNWQKDIIMSSDPNAEYGNKLPIKKEMIPFELKDDECVISYKEDEVVKYFKIQVVIEKQMEQFPSAPRKPN